MAASLTDLITRVRNGARPTATTVTSTRAVAGTVLSCGSLSGWPTASAVHFVTYKIDTSSNVIAGSQCDWKGIVSGTTITNLTLKDGTDVGNAIGDVVEMLPTAAWGEDLAEGLELEHNRNGTHSTITATSINVSGTATFATGAIAPTALATAIPSSKLSNPYKFRVYRSAAYTSINSTSTVIPFDARSYDTGSNVDITTNKGRFTAPIAGFYQFNAAFSATSNIVSVVFWKNGTVVSGGQSLAGISTSAVTVTGSDVLQLAAGDYIEAVYFVNGAVAVAVGAVFTYFSGYLVSST